MSLEYALLGFLHYKPISGYDLKKMFDSTINHFWPADQSQIYRTLNKLTKDEFIEMELIIQSNKPNSKIYHITEKGKEEFFNWLKSPASVVEPRIPWLIQVYFAAQLSDDEIINIFQKVAIQIQNRIESFKKINKEEIFAKVEGLTKRDLFFKELTYDYGIMLLNAILNWIEKVIEQIKNEEYQNL